MDSIIHLLNPLGSVVAIPTLLILWFSMRLYQAISKFRNLKAQGIPIMTHSFLLGHLLIVRQFYLDWASDANFIQTFGYYISKHWRRFSPDEDQCPPVVYVDVWPISAPMAFSMEAYVSYQIEIGTTLLPRSPMQGEFLNPISKGKDLNCENGAWGQVFQLEQISSNLAFDVAGRVVLGTRLNSRSPNPSLFTVAYREQLERMEITLNVFKLIWRATPMFKLAVRRKRQQLFEFLRPFVMDSFGTPKPGPRTILQAGVKEVNHGAIEKGTSTPIPGESLIELVFCQLMVFFFGGDDIVSITLPQIFRHLQLHPECLAKLRAEHDTVFGPDPNIAADMIREALHILDSLSYAQGVIKESLRLNPATITIRKGQPNFTFKIAGSDIAWLTQGFDLFDSSITIHRDPANFPDPLDFIPERFMVPENDPLHPPKNAWRAFQLGPRKCIGRELVMVELKLALVLVARKFDVEMAWEEWDKMREKQGLKVTKQVVEGDIMYTTGKLTSHPRDGAPAHYFKIRTSTSGGSAFAIFESSQAASDAIGASPLIVSLSDPSIPNNSGFPTQNDHINSSSLDGRAPNSHDDAHSQTIECTIAASEYDHEGNMRKNPYNMGFQISRHWLEVQDLMRSPICRAPLAEYADCFTRRKFSMPFRIQDRIYDETVKAGGTSLMDMWRQGLEAKKREEAGSHDIDQSKQKLDSA
ncbi:uncharacterized protein GIQ15_06035 [Arthroderma uncinatum]|uniref:uncharacterized protein n=1 Tax=Arthroderma uncinatum TaxID=74035 RepID=UPI00144A91A4|nr:uncharacterized protein GIQ15_06035 [Arthroderma uncinatum]KAF3480688.1 hypothetical protein GIQ15_06035 [Arthroderma uncinatum]